MSKYLEYLARPDELWAMATYMLGPEGRVPKRQDATPSLRRCYELLNMTSRSFAVVIQKLDDELRAAVCLFYLVLRGLDTVEDDMTLPISRKVPLLIDFHNVLRQPGWTFNESGPNEKDRQLLVEFDQVIAEFHKLKPDYQDAIADITKRMGAGMAEFIEKKSVDTNEEWDLYCHYVAGLVGIGLARLFSRSGLEAASVQEHEDLANGMGLFLQKTNIIRDYLEDINDGRIFWPRQVWSRYAADLADFKRPAHKVAALACLNHLITDALRHVPQVFQFMGSIKNQSVFNFCAIPQVMAIATLARCYNNHGVFTGVVKIRRGESVKLILRAKSMDALAQIFHEYLVDIEKQFIAVETSSFETAEVIRKIRKQAGLPESSISGQLVRRSSFGGFFVNLMVPLALLAGSVFLYGKLVTYRR